MVVKLTLRIMGWIDDVGAVGQDYALTSTFLWIGIIAGEPIVRFSTCFFRGSKPCMLIGSVESTRSEVAFGQTARYFNVHLDRCKSPSSFGHQVKNARCAYAM